MTDPIQRVFTWDAPGASGVSVNQNRARTALCEALQTSPIGSVGELWANVFSGSDYVRDRILGRAMHVDGGVEWVPEDRGAPLAARSEP